MAEELRPAHVPDDRERKVFAIARLGQAEFARKVKAACGRKCVLSGISEDGAMQASHIYSVARARKGGLVKILGPDGMNFMDPSNGLWMRSDLHGLMDKGKIKPKLSDDEQRVFVTFHFTTKVPVGYVGSLRDGEDITSRLPTALLPKVLKWIKRAAMLDDIDGAEEIVAQPTAATAAAAAPSAAREAKKHVAVAAAAVPEPQSRYPARAARPAAGKMAESSDSEDEQSDDGDDSEDRT